MFLWHLCGLVGWFGVLVTAGSHVKL